MGFATPDGDPPDSVPATGTSTCSEVRYTAVHLEEDYGDIEARIELQFEGLNARLEMESVFREVLTSR